MIFLTDHWNLLLGHPIHFVVSAAHTDDFDEDNIFLSSRVFSPPKIISAIQTAHSLFRRRLSSLPAPK